MDFKAPQELWNHFIYMLMIFFLKNITWWKSTELHSYGSCHAAVVGNKQFLDEMLSQICCSTWHRYSILSGLVLPYFCDLLSYLPNFPVLLTFITSLKMKWCLFGTTSSSKSALIHQLYSGSITLQYSIRKILTFRFFIQENILSLSYAIFMLFWSGIDTMIITKPSKTDFEYI